MNSGEKQRLGSRLQPDQLAIAFGEQGSQAAHGGGMTLGDKDLLARIGDGVERGDARAGRIEGAGRQAVADAFAQHHDVGRVRSLADGRAGHQLAQSAVQALLRHPHENHAAGFERGVMRGSLTGAQRVGDLPGDSKCGGLDGSQSPEQRRHPCQERLAYTAGADQPHPVL